MGKYDKVIGSLPRLPEHDDDDDNYAAKVQDAVKTLLNIVAVPMEFHFDHTLQLEEATAEEAIKAWRELRELAEGLSKFEKLVKLQIAALAFIIEKKFEERGITSLRLLDGKGARSQPEPIGQVDDVDKLVQWLKNNGMERFLGINYQRLQGIVRDRLLEGLESPDGVKVYYRPKIVKM